MESLPDKEQAYIKSLCQIVKDVVGDKSVVGIYLFGSASQGAYIVGKSDLDIQVVTHDLLSEEKSSNLLTPCLIRTYHVPQRS